MSAKGCFYFTVFLLLFFPYLSYSDTGASATIQAIATVADPIGISTVSSSEIESAGLSEDLAFFDGDSKECLILRIPDGESVICLLETDSGIEYQYLAESKYTPLSYLENRIFKNNSAEIRIDLPESQPIEKITIIYTEN